MKILMAAILVAAGMSLADPCEGSYNCRETSQPAVPAMTASTAAAQHAVSFEGDGG
jgi:hypothetical protein